MRRGDSDEMKGCECPVLWALAAGLGKSYTKAAGGVTGLGADWPPGVTRDCTARVHEAAQVPRVHGVPEFPPGGRTGGPAAGGRWGEGALLNGPRDAGGAAMSAISSSPDHCGTSWRCPEACPALPRSGETHCSRATTVSPKRHGHHRQRGTYSTNSSWWVWGGGCL